MNALTRRSFLAGGLLAPLARAGGRPPRILLRSSWQTVNIGDVGHTPGMLTLLGELLPAAEVTLWPSNVGDGVRAMLKKRFPKVAFAESSAEVKAAFDKCDFLLHGSGPSLVAQKQVAAWKDKTGKPYGVLGITLSGVDTEVRRLLDGAAFVYFRDTISLKLAKDKGIKCPVMAFGPDAAFAVDLRDDERAAAFLKKHGLEDGKFLCAIPRYRNTPYWLIHGREMTAADRAKDQENQANKETDHAKVRDALVAFVRKTGMKVLVCPEDKSHMAIGKEMFVEKVPKDVRDKLVWREDYWLTDEALSVYIRSLGLLSMDMHSPIMAVGNGIPAIHCRFRQQTSKGQMWKDVGLGDWLFDLDVVKDGDGITKAVLAIAADPLAARRLAVKAREYVRGKHKEAIATLAKRLPG